MRVKLFSLCLFSPFLVFGVVVPSLPPGEFADTEVSTNLSFAVSFETMSRVQAAKTDVSQVSGTNDTDGAGLDGMGHLMMMGSMAPDLTLEIDATDIAHGYRLDYSTENAQVSYEMPEGVLPAGTWHLTAAYDDVLSVGLDGFVFPLGRELCSSLWAHTWGTARREKVDDGLMARVKLFRMDT